MARSYKRDSNGRFAGGGGGGGGGRKGGGGKAKASGSGKGTVSQRKAAINREVTGAALLGKGKRNPQRERYITSQNRNKVAAEAKRGSGNKAARRAAGVMERSAIASQKAKFSGKSAKNTAARAKYKAAAGKARDFAKTAAKVAANPKAKAKDKAFWNRQAAGAKSGLTRISKNLSGKGKAKRK